MPAFPGTERHSPHATFSQASVINSFGAGFIGICLGQILTDLCYLPVMACHGDGGRN